MAAAVAVTLRVLLLVALEVEFAVASVLYTEAGAGVMVSPEVVRARKSLTVAGVIVSDGSRLLLQKIASTVKATSYNQTLI